MLQGLKAVITLVTGMVYKILILGVVYAVYLRHITRVVYVTIH